MPLPKLRVKAGVVKVYAVIIIQWFAKVLSLSFAHTDGSSVSVRVKLQFHYQLQTWVRIR